jgi:uncharacterized membrane protein YjdF
MSGEKANKAIVWVTTVILIAFEIYSLTTDSHYKWDFIFLMIMLWAVYGLRKKIKLHPFHFILLAVFLILHNLGTFDTYSMYFFGLEYDLYVHGFFGFVAALMLYRTYNLVGPYKGWFVYIAIIAVLLGFSAFHELFEYAGALIVGEGEGVLFVGAGDIDEWDTQKDMFNNMVGGIVALLLYKIQDYNSGNSLSQFRKKRRKNSNKIN